MSIMSNGLHSSLNKMIYWWTRSRIWKTLIWKICGHGCEYEKALHWIIKQGNHEEKERNDKGKRNRRKNPNHDWCSCKLLRSAVSIQNEIKCEWDPFKFDLISPVSVKIQKYPSAFFNCLFYFLGYSPFGFWIWTAPFFLTVFLSAPSKLLSVLSTLSKFT